MRSHLAQMAQSARMTNVSQLVRWAELKITPGGIVDRRLATILMAADETRTHQRWMMLLSDVIFPRRRSAAGN